MSDVRCKKWQVETLRLSAFLKEPIDPLKEPLWEHFSGEQPEESHILRLEQRRTDKSPFLDGSLSLESSISRYDLKLEIDLNNLTSELPVIGLFSDVETKFRARVEDWLVHSPDLHRLAFGAVLLLPVESLSEANNKLNKFLPFVEIDSDDSSDFLYRINRRREFTFNGEKLVFNRLATWSSIQLSQIQFSVSNSDPKFAVLPHTSEPSNACRLELDINTVQQYRGNFNGSLATEIFRQLADNAGEIAEKGDKK